RHQRQFDHKGRASRLSRTLDRDGAAVQLAQAADQGEAETETAARPRARGVTLSEAVEDVRQELRRDADAGVAHHDLHVRIHPLQLDLHAARLRGELHRVAQEVPHYLAQPVRIAAYRAARRGQHRLQLDALRLRGGADGVHALADHRPQIHRLDVEPDLAGADARDVQQLVDQPHLGVDV